MVCNEACFGFISVATAFVNFSCRFFLLPYRVFFFLWVGRSQFQSLSAFIPLFHFLRHRIPPVQLLGGSRHSPDFAARARQRNVPWEWFPLNPRANTGRSLRDTYFTGSPSCSLSCPMEDANYVSLSQICKPLISRRSWP